MITIIYLLLAHGGECVPKFGFPAFSLNLGPFKKLNLHVVGPTSQTKHLCCRNKKMSGWLQADVINAERNTMKRAKDVKRILLWVL